MNDKVLNIVIKAQDEASKAMSQVKDNADAFGAGMKKVALVTAVAGVAVTAFAKSSTNLLEQTVLSSKQLSRETGMNVEQSSKLLAVTKRLGLETGEVSAMFGLFSKQITDSRNVSADAASKQADLKNKIEKTKIQVTELNAQLKVHGDKTGEVKNKIEALNLKLQDYQKNLTDTTNPLQRLNIATQNADGSNKDFHAILLAVADRFKAMPGGAEKTAAALELFGRSGKALLPVLNQGSEGITRLEKNADKLGITLTQKNIGAVSAYIEAQKKLKDSTDGVKMAVATLTTPVLTELSTKVNSLVQRFQQSDGPMKTFVINFLAFGGPILGATAAMLAFLGSIVQAGPALGVIGGFFANPFFLGFAAVAIGIAGAIIYLRSQFDSWGATASAVRNSLSNIWTVLVTNLGPSLSALWGTITTQVLPALQQMWNMVSPILIPVLRNFAWVMGTEIVGALWAAINLINGMLKAMSDLIGWINRLDGNAHAASKSIMNAFETMAGPLGPMIHALQVISGLLDTIKGKKNNLNPTPSVQNVNGVNVRVPGFASGVQNYSGGLAMVGEDGPELVNLPRGSSVYPNKESQGLGGVTVHIHGNVVNETPEAANAFWDRVNQTQRLARLGMA
jgi:hypothetical protein